MLSNICLQLFCMAASNVFKWHFVVSFFSWFVITMNASVGHCHPGHFPEAIEPHPAPRIESAGSSGLSQRRGERCDAGAVTRPQAPWKG